MYYDNFGATIKLSAKRAHKSARCFTSRAFFMSESHRLDSLCHSKKKVTVASLFERQPEHPHLNCSLCDSLIVGGEGGNRFLFASTLTIKLK